MKEKEMERLLKALANKRRLEIVKYLKNKKEATVTDIASGIKLSFKATSKHLGLLYNADIVEKEQRSLQMHYHLHSNLHPIVKYISNSLE
ncbi:MAG: winged helix-turn-helix transcriptional regulator [Candidatus Pacebacteria bacterium]|nr:winged helix-turn-helix transcriptional regulator [Candidatus Paceibacterota bacterium]